MDLDSVLIVEDESVVALDIQLQLEELGYRVAGTAESGEQAIQLARQHAPAVALMDVRLEGSMDGIEAAAIFRRELAVPVVFLTSHSDIDTVRRAAQTSPYGYLTKPFQIGELRAGIEVALTKSRLERQLRESDRWFASTLQCVQDGVIVTGLDARVRFLNPAAEALTGWSMAEAVGRDVAEIARFDPSQRDDRPMLPNAVVSALARRRVVDVRHARQLLRRDHNYVPVDECAGPVQDERGDPLGAVMVLRDARQRLRQEAQLRSSEQRFRDTFDHAPLGMALVTLDGRFLQVNAALCRMLGCHADWLHEQSNGAITHPGDVDHEASRLSDLMTRSIPLVQFEKRYLRRDGQTSFWALVGVSLMREGDLPTCLLYQIHDLTDQKKAAEQLAEVAEQRIKLEVRERIHRDQSEFMSRVSHELRTPLNAVLGFAQLLQISGNQDAAIARSYADHIVSAGSHLLAMVNDVLDLQRASEGVLSLQMTSVSPEETVGAVTQLLGPMAGAQNISFSTRIAPGLRVHADATRLRQVLLNLATNAVKYNRPGGTVAFVAEQSANGRVAVMVEDDGIGMTADQMERLFQPFDRLGREKTRVEGVGLGLVITRSLVEQMGGTIRFESQPRGGTRAHLDLEAC